jgi:hypothetical protein
MLTLKDIKPYYGQLSSARFRDETYMSWDSNTRHLWDILLTHPTFLDNIGVVVDTHLGLSYLLAVSEKEINKSLRRMVTDGKINVEYVGKYRDHSFLGHTYHSQSQIDKSPTVVMILNRLRHHPIKSDTTYKYAVKQCTRIPEGPTRTSIYTYLYQLGVSKAWIDPSGAYAPPATALASGGVAEAGAANQISIISNQKSAINNQKSVTRETGPVPKVESPSAKQTPEQIALGLLTTDDEKTAYFKVSQLFPRTKRGVDVFSMQGFCEAVQTLGLEGLISRVTHDIRKDKNFAIQFKRYFGIERGWQGGGLEVGGEEARKDSWSDTEMERMKKKVFQA